MQQNKKRKHSPAQVMQDSEPLLHAFATHNIDGIALINEDGIIAEWNHVMEDVTGLSAAETLGMKMWDIQLLLIPEERRTPEARKHYEGIFQEILQTGVIPERIVSNESQVYRKDGREVFAEQKLFIIQIEAANWLGAVVRDITDRKRTDEQIRKQAARAETLGMLSHALTQVSQDYKLALDTVVRRSAELIGDGASIFLYSPGSEFLQLAAVYNPDPKAVEIFREEMLARPIRVDEGAYAKVITNDQPVLIASIPIDLLIERSSPERREYYEKLPLYSMMLAPLHVQGKILGVIGLGRHAPGKDYTPEDLTFLQDIADRSALAMLNAQIYKELEQELAERKRTEQALIFSEGKFSKAFHITPVLMSIEDSDGRFIDVNSAFVNTIGYKREDVIGRRASDLQMYASPEDLQIVRDAYQTHGSLKDLEMRFSRKSGEVGVVLMSSEKFDVNDRAYTVTSALDITERKHAEAEREKLIAELGAKNAELERFTYTVSHDLKSPLITIRGFLGFIEQDAESSNMNRLKGDIKRISDATDTMQRLLDELLELSRIGRVRNEPELIPFEELARKAVELVQGRIVERGMEVHIDSNMPAVFGDSRRLIEVLQNLVDNAAKFMGDQPNPRIEIGQRGQDAERGNPIFFVKDNGIGIAPEHHERIFGLFNQLDPKMEGTGVGLTLVKRIVELHGGRIWVESEPDKGAAFFFTLSGQASEAVE